ncbi:hypothetical protein D3C85_1534270 [compost metagenome]
MAAAVPLGLFGVLEAAGSAEFELLQALSESANNVLIVTNFNFFILVKLPSQLFVVSTFII